MELLLNAIHASFMLIFNIYLAKLNYLDPVIAEYTSYRYLAVMLAALPVGLLIKTRKLKPFFVISALTMPVFSMLILIGIELKINSLMYSGMFLWGASLTLMQVCALPYILRVVPSHLHSEAISLNYANYSLATLLVGVVIHWICNDYISLVGLEIYVNEAVVLMMVCIVGCFAVLFAVKLKEPPLQAIVNAKYLNTNRLKEYDWRKIIKILVPTTILASGAGLMIPFINLFFYNVFKMDSDTFSLIGAIAYCLVFLGAFIVPLIKKNYGYKIAITLIQCIAVACLFAFSFTELVAEYAFAVHLAVLFFWLRQPLMNIAGPMTNQLTMSYVGKGNQELMAAFHSGIWSGAWYFSALTFQWLRTMQISYYQIFILTGIFYTIGVFLYYLIILEFEKEQGQT